MYHQKYCLLTRRSLLILNTVLLLFLCFCVSEIKAETTPPVTSSSLSGTAGQSGWYRSNIDVTLDVTDSGSGPMSTTYWIDSAAPTTVNFPTSSAPTFLNPSYEQGSFLNISNWNQGPGGLVLYYQSNVSPYDGNKTAAIAFVGLSSTFYYWSNESKAVAFTPGQVVQISAWARTVMFPGDYAYFEVWGQRQNGTNDQLLASSEHLEGFIWGWRNATAQFTVPSDTNYIYLKVGAIGTPAAIVYWDNIQTSGVNTNAQVNFTQSTEGNHTLHYYSRDNDNNTEAEKTTSLKKDTVIPNPWQTFASINGGCAVCFTTSADVVDQSSGADVSTAEYRYYTKYNNQFWSNWSPVSSITNVSNGVAASDGATNYVKLQTPELNFGDNADRPFRVQFRIADMAGNSSDSPVYEIASPWIKATGSIYIDGEISIPYPATGENHSPAEAFSATDIVTFADDPDWYDETYIHAVSGSSQIVSILPNYDDIKLQALPLPGDQLPTTNGIYIVNDDFDIKSQTIPTGYDGASVSAVVIVTGDVTVMEDLPVSISNHTVYLIEGDMTVLPNVEEFGGVYIVTNQFESDSSGSSHRPLTVNGAVLALSGYVLPRDLGDGSGDSNLNTPSELFNWQPGYLLDSTLASYLTNQGMKYSWQEIEKP
ncbi:hypothetical protein HGA91_04295 [candidate division WWE3 bacterium]|nr:hypothetical protein [candidate division WWE3 bacterium]